MQYTHSELYEEVNVKNDIPLHKVKFVGDVVFNSINKNLKEPDAIILKIKGIGKFFIRKTKLDKYIDILNNRYIFAITEEDRELINKKILRLQERQIDYKSYLEEKQRIKKLRHVHQKVIQPLIQEEEI